MGQIIIISEEQKQLLEEFKKDDYLTQNFYFSGGTALSLFYLQHRTSVDLDFFSLKEFDSQVILTKLTNWQDKLNFQLRYTPLEVNHVFDLTFKNGNSVKVDFVYYPYKSLEPQANFDGVPVDSLLDIGVNKLLMVEQRTEIKDFVDLYFILKKFILWDLLAGIKPKFNLDVDNFVLASDLLKIEKFDYLPEMVKPLLLNDLKDYFKNLAKTLGKKSTEE